MPRRRQGDRDEEEEDDTPRLKPSMNPSLIKNKRKREEVWGKLKHEKSKTKAKERKRRKKEAEALGEEAPPKLKPHTQDDLREADETIVDPDDEEVAADEGNDEFASYFAGKPPKTLITTSGRPSKHTIEFLHDVLKVFPGSVYYPRRTFDVKQIVEYAKNRDFTNILVWNEDRKKINGLWVVHLPYGPTAHFRVTNVVLSQEIRNHGTPTKHRPELILNNFNTRLGHRVGRLLAALFPFDPEFSGRRVATFHNQRDYVFFRQHRYIFHDAKKTGLQELGPRFTLKLRALQKGTFDTQHGEYEWVHKTEMDTSRRRFFL